MGPDVDRFSTAVSCHPQFNDWVRLAETESRHADSKESRVFFLLWSWDHVQHPRFFFSFAIRHKWMQETWEIRPSRRDPDTGAQAARAPGAQMIRMPADRSSPTNVSGHP
eukprot:gene22984-biopygen20793